MEEKEWKRIRSDRKSLIQAYRKAAFYVRNYIKYYMPDRIYAPLFMRLSKVLTDDEQREVETRAAYYLRLRDDAAIDKDRALTVGTFKKPTGPKPHHSAYFFDLHDIVRLFPRDSRFHRIFGDINYESPLPAFVKSRPITDGQTNSVLLKLNKIRHFRSFNDGIPFREKKDMIVFRNIVSGQPHRELFVALYHDNPMCDVGQSNVNKEHPEYMRPYMGIRDQLKYKFIACIEGYDVASNLKWVMSSRSLAVMPKPKIESWFMEGTLIGGYHYVEIKPDYSDLIDKMRYYISHPDEAEAITRHANEYTARFRNTRLERRIQYVVADRYFKILS